MTAVTTTDTTTVGSVPPDPGDSSDPRPEPPDRSGRGGLVALALLLVLAGITVAAITSNDSSPSDDNSAGPEPTLATTTTEADPLVVVPLSAEEAAANSSALSELSPAQRAELAEENRQAEARATEEELADEWLGAANQQRQAEMDAQAENRARELETETAALAYVTELAANEARAEPEAPAPAASAVSTASSAPAAAPATGDHYRWVSQAAPGRIPEGVSGPVVNVAPGQDINAIVASAPAGAVFHFAPGLYYNQEINPRNGDSFLGFGQAVLDGSGTSEGTAAFTGKADDVTISGFEVRYYPTVSQNGAVNAQLGGSDDPPADQESHRWRLEDLEVHHNRGAGINIGPAGVVRRVHVHHNGQLGLTAHSGSDIVIENCEVSHNNTDGHDADFEAGGSKFKFTDRLTVRNCWFHDNLGYGIWTDIDNTNVLFENNYVENETHTCIFQEIGGSAIIRNNTVRRCGLTGDPWMRRAGIRVNNSTDVLIENNTVIDSFNGIAIIFDQQRADRYTLDRITVTGNNVINSAQNGLVTDVYGVDVTQRQIFFSNNRYTHGLPSFEDSISLPEDVKFARKEWQFRWGDAQLTAEEWAAIGNS